MLTVYIAGRNMKMKGCLQHGVDLNTLEIIKKFLKKITEVLSHKVELPLC